MARGREQGSPPGAPSADERQQMIDHYVEELAELIALDEDGDYAPGSVTLAWMRADGTSTMMTVPPAERGARASLAGEDAFAGLATGGRAAAVFDWGVSDAENRRSGRDDEAYDVVAVVGPFPGEDGMSGKLAVFRLLITRREELRVEIVELDDERRRELISLAYPALSAMTGIGAKDDPATSAR